MLASFCRFLFLSIFSLLAVFLSAQPVEVDELIEIDVLFDSTEGKSGQGIWVAFQVRLAPHWHIYWKNAGESGYPTTIRWEVPEGWNVGSLQFPTPYLYLYEGMSGYALENNFTLLTEIKAPVSVGEDIEIQATFDALVCNESTCLPYEKTFSISFNRPAQPRAEDQMLLSIEQAKSLLPMQEPSVSGSGSFVGTVGEITLSSPLLDGLAVEEFQFFPDLPSVSIDHQAGLSFSSDGALLISCKLSEGDASSPQELKGVLTHPEFAKAWEISVPLVKQEPSVVVTVTNNEQQVLEKNEYLLLYSLLALVFVAMAAWAYGKATQAGSSSKYWYLFACCSLAWGLWLAYPNKPSFSTANPLRWQQWSPQLQNALIADGKPVYIDYTAKWCLSCQVNKRVYEVDEVKDTLLDQKVELLRADWTQKSPQILQSLQSYGREGVPFNVFYPAGQEGKASRPVYLPEILSSDHLIKIIKTGHTQQDTSLATNSFWTLLGLGWLGGLILNIMPCVFPVIGLKIMSFVKQAGDDPKLISSHGLIFTLGVLLSFWVLVGILLLLRQGLEQQLGWGFQLQEPLFVLVLSVFLFLFGLSLSGVFEIGFSFTGVGSELSQKSGLVGSFFSGVLATVVATPCMAPFLGVAVGAALTMSPVSSFAIFTSIAIGLSTPYLLLSFYPNWLNKLPRPGAWMETFKQFMAFPIYATVAWLVWTLDGLIQ